MAVSVIFCHTSIKATAPALYESVFCTITFIIVNFVTVLLSCFFVLCSCVTALLFPQVVLGNMEIKGGGEGGLVQC